MGLNLWDLLAGQSKIDFQVVTVFVDFLLIDLNYHMSPTYFLHFLFISENKFPTHFLKIDVCKTMLYTILP